MKERPKRGKRGKSGKAKEGKKKSTMFVKRGSWTRDVGEGGVPKKKHQKSQGLREPKKLTSRSKKNLFGKKKGGPRGKNELEKKSRKHSKKGGSETNANFKGTQHRQREIGRSKKCPGNQAKGFGSGDARENEKKKPPYA